MTRISAHCLVKNEARFIWYSLNSVIKLVDRLRITDTGSTDNTIAIIKKFIQSTKDPSRIIFEQFSSEENFDEKKYRDQMLNADIKSNDMDWFLIIDGDEIWWDKSIEEVVKTITKEGDKIESIIVPVRNLVGDMYHYQEEVAGKYQFENLPRGHYNLRAFRKNIPGLYSKGEYGVFGWYDKDNKMIQERGSSKVRFINSPYIHTTHLLRSNLRLKDWEVIQRKKKYKYEIGISFPKDYYYPEVLFRAKPDDLEDIWQKTNINYRFRALIETPFKLIKRRLLSNG